MTSLTGRVRCAVADHDRGASEPVALAILTLPVIFLLGLLMVGGRIAIASQSINGIAASAARDASIARTAAQAQQIASSSALSSLRAQHLNCLGTPDVVVDTSSFQLPPGTPAAVTVRIGCVVSLSDIGIAGLPGTRTLKASASSALDPYRSIS